VGEHFTLNSGSVVAEVQLHSNGICGTGRAAFPVLVLSLQMLFRCPEQSVACLDFRELRSHVAPFDGAYVAVSLPSHLGVSLISGKEINNHLVQLQIPLDRTRLALIDRLRKR